MTMPGSPALQPSPAYQCYPRDHLADGGIRLLTLEALGAWQRLRWSLWLARRVCVADVPKLVGASAAQWRRIGPAVLACGYEVSDDGYVSCPALDAERAAQAARRTERSTSGRRGADRRWGNRRQPVAELSAGDGSATPQPMASDASASASASASVSSAVAEPWPRARAKPLGYRPRIDVAWPGRPPVPGSLHAEFRDKLGGDPAAADAELRAWYPVAAAPFDDQPIGDDDFAFWRARFLEWVGTTRRPVPARVTPADTGGHGHRCPHDPPCRRTTECVARIIEEARGARQEATA